MTENFSSENDFSPQGNRRNQSGDGRILRPEMRPQAIEVEQLVLGAILVDSRGIASVVDALKPEMFYDPKHQIIYAACNKLFNEGKPIELITVLHELENQGKEREAGGAAYLNTLASSVTSAANIEEHAKIIQEKYFRRAMIDTGQFLQKSAYDETQDIFNILENAEQEIFSLSQGNFNQETKAFDQFAIKLKEKLEELGKEEGLPGLSSGFPSIDDVTSGWHKGDLIILAGRPAMGKTALALNFARHIAFYQNKPVAFFSLEMPGEQLVARVLSAETQIPSYKFRRATLNDEDYIVLNNKLKYISEKAHFLINDASMMTVFELRTHARRLKMKYKIEALFIDYLQLLRASDKFKTGNREQEIATISRNLKALAKELDIPVIALSQLSRKVEERYSKDDHKRPQLSDLRESGAIEQDADLVAFVYRPEYYKIKEWDDDEHTPTENTAEFIIAKHRHGKTDSIRLRFLKEYGLFQELNQPVIMSDEVQEFQSKINNNPGITPDYRDSFGSPENPENDENPDIPF